MNVNIASTEAAGRTAGMHTLRNIRNTLQPSTRAASISSYGTASTVYWRIQKTPNAVTRFGTITACRCPAQPNFAIAMNNGITPSWVGTAKVTTMNTNNALLPRNRSLAKANPASEENSTVVRVTVPDTIRLLSKAFQNGTVLNTLAAFEKKFPPGISGGMWSPSIEASRLATRNCQ